MKRSRQASSEGFSLFPFLAVLLCVMGCLIVLLVVLMQQANVQAAAVTEQRAAERAAAAEALDKVRIETEDARWRIETLEGSRTATAEDLDNRRRELSHLEDEVVRLREQLELAAREAERMEKSAQSQQNDESVEASRLAALRDALADAERKLADARAAQKTKKKAYAIIPYAGPNGTQRRPIYVECLADRVVIQPEGIEFKAEDFEEPITDDNPLAASLRAVREYWKDASGDSESLPYPLLVVRPSGTQSYAAARAAMKSWDTEFGYELVEDQLTLAYPEPDATLRTRLEETVEMARARRVYLQSIAPARFGRAAPPMLTASRAGGGFVNSAGQPAGRAQRRGGNGRGAAVDGADAGDGKRTTGMGADSHALAAAMRKADGPDSGVGGADGNTRASERPLQGHEPGRGSANRAGGGDPSGTSGRSPNTDDGPNGGAAGPRGDSTTIAGDPRDKSGARAGASRVTGGGSSSGPGNSQGQNAQGEAGTPSALTAGSPAMAGAPKTRQGKNTRGDNWGLPSSSVGATGITRSVEIACEAERVVLLPESRRGKVVELPVDGSMRDEIDQLVSQLWKRIETWGIAGDNMYWKPTLEVRVAPGAEDRFEEFVELLEGSGLEVHRKP